MLGCVGAASATVWWLRQGWKEAAYFFDRAVRVSAVPEPWWGYLADVYLQLDEIERAKSIAGQIKLENLSEELRAKPQLVELVQSTTRQAESQPAERAKP